MADVDASTYVLLYFSGAMSFPIPWVDGNHDYNTVRMVVLWLYFHAAAYSPGLGACFFLALLVVQTHYV